MGRDVHLNGPSIGEQFIIVQGRDDEVSGAGVGLVSDEVEGEILSRGGFEGGGEISAILDFEDDGTVCGGGLGGICLSDSTAFGREPVSS